MLWKFLLKKLDYRWCVFGIRLPDDVEFVAAADNEDAEASANVQIKADKNTVLFGIVSSVQ